MLTSLSLSDWKMEILSHGGESFYGNGTLTTQVDVNPHNAVVEQIGLGWNKNMHFYLLTDPPPFSFSY